MKRSSVLHSPTIEAFQLEKIRHCAHVVTFVLVFVGGKPFKDECRVQFELQFACRATVKMFETGVRSNEAWASVIKKLPY